MATMFCLTGSLAAVLALDDCEIAFGAAPLAWGFTVWWAVDTIAKMTLWPWRNAAKLRKAMLMPKNLSTSVLLIGAPSPCTSRSGSCGCRLDVVPSEGATGDALSLVVASVHLRVPSAHVRMSRASPRRVDTGHPEVTGRMTQRGCSCRLHVLSHVQPLKSPITSERVCVQPRCWS